LISLSYRMELVPAGDDLRIRYFEPSGRPLCALRVLAPTRDEATRVFPNIVIKSTLLSCRGDAIERPVVARE
jgi:hypothetical protein